MAESGRKTRIAYMYDPDIGCYDYEPGHCMKPFRIRMTHDLVMSYGLYKKMEVYRAKPATAHEMTQFHTDEYIDFLQNITPDTLSQRQAEAVKYDISGDCPVFDGLYEYCTISAGASMEAAARLNRGRCDIAVNWAGGLHHAKKGQAGGFCYVNDIVLAILELLRVYSRVLYIDIDIHHGDGVEEAFYTTDRVMTASFHKFGEFYPGTGHINDVGVGKGKKYAVNVPLRDGIDDAAYKGIFEAVISDIMTCFRPEAIVLQCGADSLSGDRLGSFNLSMEGHANCVEFVKKFNIPMMIVGGGGYSIRNVARTWAFETAKAIGEKPTKVLPFSDYYEYYSPEYLLDVPRSNATNDNNPEYLDRIRQTISERLRSLPGAPSVQMMDVPRHSIMGSDDEDELLADLDADQNADERMSGLQQDMQIVNDAELYDSDAEDERNHDTTVPAATQADDSEDEDMLDVGDRPAEEAEADGLDGTPKDAEPAAQSQGKPESENAAPMPLATAQEPSVQTVSTSETSARVEETAPSPKVEAVAESTTSVPPPPAAESLQSRDDDTVATGHDATNKAVEPKTEEL
ncbi:histone deacetylase Hda1 [Saccharata proteae CBS 121410]|uniref:histone deacetylase n=1 Tax=Saccharata proteae CBS 121410 TaxID=1314787 RepID=A0A9P4HZX1_9PEZI|nr:histone deacetylase Hda1 [Saccharata proteae CBS 121410]